MRKLLGLSVLLWAGVCWGGGLKVGGHAMYVTSPGGAHDTFGYGAQVGARVNETLSLELSATAFDDEFDAVDSRLVTVAVSGRLGGGMGEGVWLYIGGGASYNFCEIDDAAWPGAEIDPTIGYHFCGGIELALSQRAELFAEYRYTSVDFDESGRSDAFRREFDEEYEFGFVRVGLNISL